MSSSAFITITPLSSRADKAFQTTLLDLSIGFKEYWKEHGTGFDKDGEISGLDANYFEDESGFWPFTQKWIHKTTQDDRYFFGHYNGVYENTWLDEKQTIHSKEIYYKFAEYMSIICGDEYDIHCNTSFESGFTFRDGKKYIAEPHDIEGFHAKRERYLLLLEKSKYEARLKKIDEELSKNIESKADIISNQSRITAIANANKKL